MRPRPSYLPLAQALQRRLFNLPATATTRNPGELAKAWYLRLKRLATQTCHPDGDYAPTTGKG